MPRELTEEEKQKKKEVQDTIFVWVCLWVFILSLLSSAGLI